MFLETLLDALKTNLGKLKPSPSLPSIAWFIKLIKAALNGVSLYDRFKGMKAAVFNSVDSMTSENKLGFIVNRGWKNKVSKFDWAVGGVGTLLPHRENQEKKICHCNAASTWEMLTRKQWQVSIKDTIVKHLVYNNPEAFWDQGLLPAIKSALDEIFEKFLQPNHFDGFFNFQYNLPYVSDGNFVSKTVSSAARKAISSNFYLADGLDGFLDKAMEVDWLPADRFHMDKATDTSTPAESRVRQRCVLDMTHYLTSPQLNQKWEKSSPTTVQEFIDKVWQQDLERQSETSRILPALG